MSLGLAADAEVQKAYDEAFNEHGFRMLNYTSDNESNAPRICVQFSDNLAKGRVDFANYVTVNGEKPASVRVQGSQLCVEDLLHGKRYEVKVRSGIPSTEGDLLAEARRADRLYPRPLAFRAHFGAQLRAAPHRPAGHSRSSASIRSW